MTKTGTATIIQLPRSGAGGLPLENALRISLMLVKSHKAGKHGGGAVTGCQCCKAKRS